MKQPWLHTKGSIGRRTGFLRAIAGPVAAISACALLLLLLNGLSRGLDYYGVTYALRATPLRLVWFSILFAAVSYLALVARELYALSHLNAKVSIPALLLSSFCSSVLSNAYSFNRLSADAFRARIYSAVGVEPEQTARVTRFVDVGFGLGLAAFTGASLMLANAGIGHLSPASIILIRCLGGIVLLAILAALLFHGRRRDHVAATGFSIDISSLAITLLEFVASIASLSVAAAGLWVLLPAIQVDFFGVAAIFAVATAVGLISRIPAGLGVFDTIVFLSLRSIVPPDQLVAALLVYRGVFFVLPLLCAATLLASLELSSAPGQFASKTGERVSSAAGPLAPILLSTITFAVGIMLVVSGATPAMDWRLLVLQGVLPLWAVEISHLLATLAGVFLLFVARGLYHRLDGAWWLALTIALVNVGFSLAKGLAFGETAALVVLVFLLLATRREFVRPAAFMHQPFRLGWFVAIAVVIACAIGILLFAFRDVAYQREIWWQFEFDAQASRSLRAILGGSILALAISLWQLLRAAPGRIESPSEEDLSRAAAIIRGQENSAAALALMGDKSFLFSNSGKSFLMYAKRGRSWVALFDPVGRTEEWPELVWRFVECADKHGGRAAFYQIRPSNLALYLDAGLRVVKVGEEACIYLDQFNLEGSERYGLRQALKRGERERLTFQILQPQRDCRQRDVLSQISERWLASHHAVERRFSVAGFEPRFVEAQSAALSFQDDKPVAFVTFMTTDLETEATIGLMRQTPGAPACTMEFMFTRLALEMKAAGFKKLSLGMVPLSGIAKTPLSSRWHRMAGLLWEHGKPIYNFQGLRGFKNKFRPVWEPRYLAASGAAGPFITIGDVVTLASGYRRSSSAT